MGITYFVIAVIARYAPVDIPPIWARRGEFLYFFFAYREIAEHFCVYLGHMTHCASATVTQPALIDVLPMPACMRVEIVSFFVYKEKTRFCV